MAEDMKRVAALVAAIERRTGGRVSFGYPVTTRAGGWRATVHGGEVGLASVTLRPPCSQEDALEALLTRLPDTQQASNE